MISVEQRCDLAGFCFLIGPAEGVSFEVCRGMLLRKSLEDIGELTKCN